MTDMEKQPLESLELADGEFICVEKLKLPEKTWV
jgi:hypothetical protein